MKKGVILLGGHIQGLNIVRIYGKKGIPVILIDRDEFNLAKHSKYCKKFYKSSDFLQLFLDFELQDRYRGWFIIPTSDLQVKILSQNRERLNSHFIVSTDKWSVVEKCYNKIETYKIAKRLSIPIPWTLFPKDKEELSNSTIEYPCIIKPAVMHIFYSKFKKKVFVCRDRDELLANYSLATQVIPKSEIIVQEIIEGDSHNQYSACFYYNRDRSYIHIVARRKRQHPVDFGNATTFAQTVQIPELKDDAEKILKEIEYSGLCEVEFKYDAKDNRYKLLEINPRTWKWHSISQKAQTPFLISIYEKMVNSRDIIVDSYKESYFKHLLLDTIMLILNRKYRETSTTPTKDMTQYAVWDREDITPAIWELIYFPYNLIKR